MDYFWWILFNGLFWPLLGIIFSCFFAVWWSNRSRDMAEQKFTKRYNELQPELIKAIQEEILPFVPTLEEILTMLEKELPGVMMKSIGGQGSQIIQEVSKTDEFTQLVEQINGNPEIISSVLNIDQQIPTDNKTKMLMHYGKKLMDIVVNGVGKKMTAKIDMF